MCIGCIAYASLICILKLSALIPNWEFELEMEWAPSMRWSSENSSVTTTPKYLIKASIASIHHDRKPYQNN